MIQAMRIKDVTFRHTFPKAASIVLCVMALSLSVMTAPHRLHCTYRRDTTA